MDRCLDEEVLDNGECLYVEETSCVLPRCAFEEDDENDGERLFYVIENGGSVKDEINIDEAG
ncbi:MAG: hypothetical protein LBJ35_01175 [Spirochaetaceae bacterium]|jgi:hypothetical protein|nr:hypothetical protein [Spirochaetaceae bacterium]